MRGYCYPPVDGAGQPDLRLPSNQLARETPSSIADRLQSTPVRDVKELWATPCSASPLRQVDGPAPGLRFLQRRQLERPRRFLVRRHLLAPPRSLPADPSSVRTVVERLGSLQFDPLEVPGARNHDLVLHARIDGYRREWCDQLLYGPGRRLIELYNKSLNMVPMHELPHYRIAWQRTLRATHKGDYMGFPATGKKLVWRDMVTSRFQDGLIQEDWVITDLAEQLLRARKR